MAQLNHFTNGPASAQPTYINPIGDIGTRPHTTHDVNFDRNGMPLGNSAEGYSLFFGAPQGTARVDPYRKVARENYDLPDAYVGQPSYQLRYVTISIIEATDEWPISKIMPWKEWDGQEIRWESWHFKDERLGNTPEESVSRLVRSYFDSKSATMGRYGLALILEYGFFRKPQGIKNYWMNLMQIANAVSWWACYGVFHALLNVPPVPGDYFGYRSGLEEEELDICIERDQWAWGIYQKKRLGFVLIYDKMKSDMINRVQKPGNVWINPAGSMKMIKLTKPEENSFLFAGPFSNKPFMGDKVNLYESRGYPIDPNQMNADPCYKRVTIGGYSHMLRWHLHNVDPKDFRLSMMDTDIYDADRNVMQRISFVDTFKKYTGIFRFNDPGVPFGAIGYSWLSKKYKSWGELYEKTDTLGYVIKQILYCINDDAYISFMDTFVNRYNGSVADDDEKERGDDDDAGNGTRVSPEELLHAMTNWQTGDGKNINNLCHWMCARSPQGLKLFSHVSSYLLGVYSEEERLGMGYLKEPPANLGGWESFFESTKEKLLDLDCDSSLSEIPQVMRTAGENATSDSNVNDNQVHWQPIKNNNNSPAVILTKKLGKNDSMATCLPTKRMVDSLTLTTKHQVLFAIEPATLREMTKDEGVDIHFYSQGKNVPRYAERVALLQLNVAMSACYQLIHQHVSGSDDKKGDTKEQLTEKLTKICNKPHAVSGNDFIMKQAVKKFTANKRALMCQYKLSGVIEALSVLVGKAVEGPLTQIDVQKGIDCVSGVKNRNGPEHNVQNFTAARVDFQEQALDSLVLNADARLLNKADACIKSANKSFRELQRAREQKDDDGLYITHRTFTSIFGASLLRKLYIMLYRQLGQVEESGAGANTTDKYMESIIGLIETVDLFYYERKNPVTLQLKKWIYYVLRYCPFDDVGGLSVEKAKVVNATRELWTAVLALARDSNQTPVEGNKDDARFKQFITLFNKFDVAVKEMYANEQTALNEQVAPFYEFLSRTEQEAFGQQHNVDSASGGSGSNAQHAQHKVHRCSFEAMRSIFYEQLLMTDGLFFKFVLDNDLVSPLGILMFRPHQTFNAGSAIYTFGGGEVGNVFYHDPNFMLTSNAAQKMIYGHFTMYGRAQLLQPKKSMVAQNVYINRYISGYGTKMYDINTSDDADNPVTDVEDYGQNRLRKDIFPFAVEVDFKPKKRYIDMSGLPHPSLRATNMDDSYSTAVHYRKAWQLPSNDSNRAQYDDDEDGYNQAIPPKHNSLCFQEHQRIYNPGTRDYTTKVINDTHWGPNIYVGVNECWNGGTMHIKDTTQDDVNVFSLL